MNFQEATLRYRRLKRAYLAGQITAEVFEKQTNLMVVLHEGQRWMIGVSSGKWYRQEGSRWVEDLPPLPPAAPQLASVQEPTTQAQAAAQPQPSPRPATQPREAPRSLVTTAQVAGERRGSRMGVGLAVAGILIALTILVVFSLYLTGTLKPGGALAGIFSVSTEAPTTTSTAPVTLVTVAAPPPTVAPAGPTVDAEAILPGAWVSGTGAEYHFYADFSFVFQDLMTGRFEAGTYRLLPAGQIAFDILQGEQVIETTQFNLIFRDEQSFWLDDADGNRTSWQLAEPPLATSRHSDPVALLVELAHRLELGIPDPRCGFDPSDETNVFRYLCIDLADNATLTWVDQVHSSDAQHPVLRSQFMATIVHSSQVGYAEELASIEDQLQAVEPFHGLPAYTSVVDMDWFAAGEYAWLDGPWLYRISRVSPVLAPFPAPGLLYSAEVLYEIQQGSPPHSNEATIPTPRTPGSFRYATEIIGAWMLRHPTTETIVFAPDGTISVTSEIGKYSYTGLYYFNSDDRITLELDAGTVEAGIRIEDEVMTLTINGIDSLYDRQPETP